jgi:glycosyltransferase involved in cell wall biosynthesis
MARILWHGIGPWHKTGYGVQTALFAPRLRDLGHQVAIAVMGRKGIDDRPDKAHPDAVFTEWEGIPVIGPGLTEFGLPLPLDIKAAFGGHHPDLVIVLKDAWVLRAASYRRYNTAVWCNIDCEPIGTPDREFFEASGAHPVAVSKFGVSVMRAAGLSPLYVPHGIDTGAWGAGDRAAARELLGLPQHTFLAGINAANVGIPSRKAFAEQFAAFASFRKRLQPDSLLLAHTHPEHPEGVNLRHLVAGLGIGDAVRFPSHINMRGGQMLTWYQSLDVLMNATYGEGFGLPIVEALACRVPVIGTECSAITEKIPPGAGWLVPGQQWWNPHHRAWWAIPNIPAMTAKLAHAYTRALTPAPQYAACYGADHVTTEYWKPALEALLSWT